MSTVNKYLLPHRATKDVMENASKSSMILRKGELFLEAPSTGVGTGHTKIKVGDGKTPYSSLPYALGDTDNEVANAIVTFTSNTGTSAATIIAGVKSGQSLATQIAGFKQAITLIANTPFTNRAFATISNGTSNISASSTADTLKIVAGNNTTVGVDASKKTITISSKDTTYNNATTGSAGLESADDKKKLDGISEGATKTSFTQSLSSGTAVGTINIDGKATTLFAPTNTDTHYEAKNVVSNGATSKANAAAENGSVFLNLVENDKVRSSHKIIGAGATKVTTDANGNVTITSTDSNTTYDQATAEKLGLIKLYDVYGNNSDGTVTQDFVSSELNKKLATSGTAAKATQDEYGNNIGVYFKDASVNGQDVTFVRGNGSTFKIHTQDENNKYYNFVGASETANGTNGLVPAPAISDQNSVLVGTGTWKDPNELSVGNASTATYAVNANKASTATYAVTANRASTATYASNAGSASSASKASTATVDSAGQQINTTYVKNVTGANATITVTKGDGQSNSFTVNNVSNAGNATKATQDSAGQQINTTYIKGVTYSDHTVTVTKGDGTTTSFVTADNNTTYGNFKGATAAAAGSAGLVPAPTTAQKDLYLKGDGTWANISGVISGTKVNNASTADFASLAANANKATQDSAGQQINTTYIKGIGYNGHTVTVTKGDGSTTSFNTADNNTTYSNFKGATTAAAGGSGLVPAPTTAQTGYFLQGSGTWVNVAGTKVNNASTADYAKSAGSAGSATKATQDSAGQQINTTYVKSISGTNAAITVTKGDGSTGTFTINNVSNAGNATKATQDSAGQQINTTYIKGVTYSDHTVTVTKGDGSTTSFNTADTNTTYSTGTDTVSGITKLYSSSGSSTDGSMTRKAITDLVNTTKSTLETAIGNINSFEIVVLTSASDLPTTGKDHTVYFVPFSGGDSDTKYEEYVWITDYYEKIGMTTADLGNYYTKSETNTQISNATNSLVQSIGYSGHTLTITKKDGTTSSFATADNNTTYTNGTGLSLSGNTFSINANASTTSYAKSAGSAGSATKATQDSAGQQINTTYVKGVTYSGHTVTITKGDGSTTSFNTADTNTTYGNFKGATASDVGSAGLVPAPTTAQTGYFLQGSGTWVNVAGTKVNNATHADSAGSASSASSATKATQDSAGQQINTTYVKGVTYSGHTVTITKGDGSTTSFNTADTNTTYGNFKGATASAAGSAGLVPAPSTTQKDLYLKGDGTWASISGVITGTKVTNAGYADSAGSANTAGSATKATQDSAGQQINTTYVKGVTYSGHTVTITKGDGTTTSFNTADNNTTYGNFKGATASAAGSAGLVPAPTTAQKDLYLKGDGTWASITGVISGTKVSSATNADIATYAKSAGSAGSAGSATKATQDSAGQQINTTYVKGVTYSGHTVTITKGDGSTSSFATADNNTTYTNGTGLSLSGNTFSINPNASSVSYASSASNSTKATQDSAGQQINTTYVKGVTYSGHTVTITKGDGSTSSFNTADSNTTYGNFKGATTAAAGGSGLVPAPTTAQTRYFLQGNGTWANVASVKVSNSTNADTATYAKSAGSASSASSAGSATKATQDSAGQQINTTYVKGVTYSGHTVTITKGDGTTTSFVTADNNTTYGNFKGSTTAAAGSAGLVPAPTTAQTGYFLQGNGAWASIAGTKVNNASTADYAKSAGSASSASSATKATQDSAGQQINTTYVKSITYSGHTVTVTKGNGATTSFATADNNTTYSSLKNPYAVTLQFNGTTNQTYDGSAAKTFNVTPAAIGAVKVAGDTMTGALKLTKSSTSAAGCTLDYDATNACLSFVFG